MSMVAASWMCSAIGFQSSLIFRAATTDSSRGFKIRRSEAISTR